MPQHNLVIKSCAVTFIKILPQNLMCVFTFRLELCELANTQTGETKESEKRQKSERGAAAVSKAMIQRCKDTPSGYRVQRSESKHH